MANHKPAPVTVKKTMAVKNDIILSKKTMKLVEFQNSFKFFNFRFKTLIIHKCIALNFCSL